MLYKSLTSIQSLGSQYQPIQQLYISSRCYLVICKWNNNIASWNVSGGSICTLDNVIYISYQYTVTGKPISTCPTAVYIFPMLSGNLQMEMQYCIWECFRWISIHIRQCYTSLLPVYSHWEANINLSDSCIYLPDAIW